MDPHDRGKAPAHHFDFNYRGYPHEEDVGRDNPDSPNLDLSLGLPNIMTSGHQPYFDDPYTPRTTLNLFPDHLESPRQMTPSTRQLSERLRRSRSRSGQGAASSPEVPEADTPRRRRSRSGQGAAVESGIPQAETPNRRSSRLREIASVVPEETPMSFPVSNYDQAGPSTYHYSGEEGSFLSPHERYGASSSSSFPYMPMQGESSANQEALMNAFTQMNVREIPVPVEASAYRQNRQQYQDQQGDVQEFQPLVDRGHNRRRLRQRWEQAHPELAIPLRLLSAAESASIGVARGSSRYPISLYLEDQYLRARDLDFAEEIEEPPMWREHRLFEPLAYRERRHNQDWKPKLIETQQLLNSLFEAQGMFKSPEERSEARRTIQSGINQRHGPRHGPRYGPREMAHGPQQVHVANPDVTPFEAAYREWILNHNGMYVPLRLMDEADLERMGLKKNTRKYNLARYYEEEALRNLGYESLCGADPIQHPGLPPNRRLTNLLTDLYPIDNRSFLHLKQKQVEEWFVANGVIVLPQD